MGTDTHIKFDGIDGESVHTDHKGEIDVVSRTLGIQNDSNLFSGGSGKGKAQPGLLKFTHPYDKASPVLAKKATHGVHFPTVVLTARESGEDQQDFSK